MNVPQLLHEIEHTNFSCEAGPLMNNSHWIALKRLLISHSSDCSLHNEPAYPAEPCDCGADPTMIPEHYHNEQPKIVKRNYDRRLGPGTDAFPSAKEVGEAFVKVAAEANRQLELQMHPKKVTLSGRPPALPDNPGAPDEIDPKTGMHKDYWVLSQEERDKGFVRPVRTSYVHLGAAGPKNPLRDLTPEEVKRWGYIGYVKWEQYPGDPDDDCNGRFWTQKQLDELGKGCKTTTTMGLALAETYARDPKFYGSTFCCSCGAHFPVDQFVWKNTNEQVGS